MTFCTHGYKCPKCGSSAIQMKKELWCDISQIWTRNPNLSSHVNITVKVGKSKIFLEDTDNLYCGGGCGYLSESTAFKWNPGPIGSIPVTAEKEVA